MAGTFPSEKIVRENRPEYVLESFFYIKPWQVEEMPKWKMFLLDSGAFTFMHGVEASSKPVDWDGYLSRYIDFINRHDVQHFFELDVDIIVGYDAVKRMRARLEAETGKRSIPVWHRSRGLDEFKNLCRDYPYIGIGGFAIKHIQPSEYGYIKRLVQYGRYEGGMRMIETKKTTAPEASVGADVVQPSQKFNTNIIANEPAQINLQTTENEKKFALNTVSMSELYDTVYPPRKPIVDGLLYGGTYLFVGAPKVGKSFFMGQLAYHVAMGLPLWEYKVHQGTVLYLALEDDYARLQHRLSRMFGVEEAASLYFATQAKTLSEGLDQQLEHFIREHPDVRLIIIDTLQKVREVGGDRYSYASDYEIVTKLKAFSDKYGICLLVVHHTRKMEAEDSFDMISGTNGLLGAADGAFILQKKKRTDNTAILDVVGRDQPDQELTLEFNRERCLWMFQKAETELWKQPPDPLLEAVSRLLSQDAPEWNGSPTELLAKLPDVGVQANVLTRKLNVSADRLYNDYGIRYESKRTHEGRSVSLKLETQGVTICDGRDGIFECGPDIENTVTIDTTVTEEVKP